MWASDVVTMGCGDACPVSRASATWTGSSPTRPTKSVEEIRPIRDEIDARVQALLVEMGVATAR